VKNVPNDQELYRRVIAEAKKKFDVYPSAYANGWVVQEYKRRGGTYRVEKARAFASRSEAGRYAASIRWQNARGHRTLAAATPSGPFGPIDVEIGGTTYTIGIDNWIVDNISGASQYAIQAPRGQTGMLQVFPDGTARVVGLPSLRASTAKLVEALQGQVAGVGLQPNSEYATQITARINSISRTASTGTIDTTGSSGKKDLGKDTTVDEKLALTKRNTQEAIDLMVQERNRPYGAYTEESVMRLMDSINVATNRGLVPPGTLMRTGDSDKYPYTKVAVLDEAKRTFAEDLANRLNDPAVDPVETAAMIHWKVNFTDHFYEDGVGRSTEVLAALPLLRAGRPVPAPSTRDDWFANAAKETGLDGFPKFLDYYRSLT
jgi:hypothetical protein